MSDIYLDVLESSLNYGKALDKRMEQTKVHINS